MGNSHRQLQPYAIASEQTERTESHSSQHPRIKPQESTLRCPGLSHMPMSGLLTVARGGILGLTKQASCVHSCA